MKTEEITKLKKVLKPLIMECIKEAIFEEGVLSTLVAEVASGIGRGPVIQEAKPEVDFSHDQNETQEMVSKRLQETRNRMLNAIGTDAYGGVDIFEGTEPLTTSGAEPASRGPLSNIDPKDKGINIDGLMGAFGKKWNALK